MQIWRLLRRLMRNKKARYANPMFRFEKIELLEDRITPSIDFLKPSIFNVGASPTRTYVRDLNNDGKADIINVNQDDTVRVFLGNGNVGFASPFVYSVGPLPQNIAFADFNEDGKDDMAVSQVGGGTSVISILMGNGDGTFQAATSLATGTTPRAVVAGDFNQDGNDDLAVAVFNTGTRLFLGNGNGTFQAGVTLRAGGNPVWLVAQDLDNDSKLDLAIAESGAVGILLNTGGGSFQTGVDLAMPFNATFLIAEDLNGDDEVDLAVTSNQVGNSAVHFRAGLGDGTFQAPAIYLTGAEPNSILSGDFNEDGRRDMAVGNLNVGDVLIMQGSANGTFVPTHRYAIGTPAPTSLAGGDFNNDGNEDLAVSAGVSTSVGLSILVGHGNGTFHAPLMYPAGSGAVGQGPDSGVVADFNSDGKNDLLVANGGDLLFYAGNNNGTLTLPVSSPIAAQATSLVAGDFNGDGKFDVAYTQNNMFRIHVRLGNGNGTFGAAMAYSTGTNPFAIAVDDVNDDGEVDLVVSNRGAGTVSVLLGIGNGSFQSAQNHSVGPAPEGLDLGDINGDGRADVAVANSGNASVAVLLANSNGSLQNAVFYQMQSTPSDVVLRDFDGDGILDLAVTDRGSHSLSFLRGNGNGSFQPPTHIPVANLTVTPNSASVPRYLRATDFDGDGILDLSMSNSQNGITVLRGVGNGSFQQAFEFRTSGGARDRGIGDINADGKPDILALLPGDYEVAVLLNTSHVVTNAPAPAVVYVNATFTGPAGSDPDGLGPATAVGYDAFTSLQQAGEAVRTGGDIYIAANVAAESLTLGKSANLYGPMSPLNGVGNVTLLSGTLGGAGVVAEGMRVAEYASLSPGAPQQAGTLSIGSLTMDPWSNFVVDAHSAILTDRVTVNGTVSLGGARLILRGNGFVPIEGVETLLIENDGNDSVVGTFSDFYGVPLANGQLVATGSYTGVIRYDGGDGNDVVIVGQSHRATMIRDLGPLTNPLGSTPEQFVSANGTIFFLARNDVHGLEVWKLQENTPVLVADINAGSADAFVQLSYGAIALGGLLLFPAIGPFGGTELWRSDGTTEGTYRLADFVTGDGDSSPLHFEVLEGNAYLGASNASGGGLYKTDGTVAGTTLVKQFTAPPTGLRVFRGEIYFAGTTAEAGRELWKSDGTTIGTVLVKEIVAGPGGTNLGFLTVANDTLYFSAFFPGFGQELGRSDGTENGTFMVADARPGSSGIAPVDLTYVNGSLFFNGVDSINGVELWKSDGASVTLVKDINNGTLDSNPQSLFAWNDLLLFIANESSTGFELYKSDGTAEGTILIKDIAIGTATGAWGEFATVNGVPYFLGSDSSFGREIWTTDGTSNGTVRVTDINPGAGNGITGQNFSLNSFNGALYFPANNGTTGVEPWKSDGTANGTVLLGEIRDGGGDGFQRQFARVPVVIGGRMVFPGVDPALSTEPFSSDGTFAGTNLLLDINVGAGSSSPSNFVEINGVAVFGNTVGLWNSNGTTAGTTMISTVGVATATSAATFRTTVNNTLYFTGQRSGFGLELWRTDGTAAGTSLVSDITPGGASTVFSGSAAGANGTLFFAASSGGNGMELWKSDGTAAGTVLVKNIAAGSSSSDPRDFVELNGILYFTALDGSGRELWRTDGTAPGTFIVKDIAAGAVSSNPLGLANINGWLYFSAASAGTEQLWKSDGTTAGTTLVRNLANATGFTDFNGGVYFSATDGVNGMELWRTDGTANGTVIVKDIFRGAGGSRPSDFLVFDNHLYFSARENATGDELWVSDGTGAGTRLVANLAAGIGGSAPVPFVMNGRLYAVANDGTHGTELWDMDPNALSSIADANSSPNQVQEGASNGTHVGITANAFAGGNATLTYNLIDSAGGLFAINPSTGNVTVANGSLLNFESVASHNITIQAISSSGGSSTANFTISVTNANPSTPTDSNNSNNSVAEGAANGTLVGITASSSDINGPAVTYSLTSNPGGRFAIDAATGVVSVANGALLDASIASSHFITVQASDGAGGTANQIFSINVLTVNLGTLIDTTGARNSVTEGAANGTLASVTAFAPHPTGNVTYSLTNDAGGRFAIDAATGVVRVANGSLLNYASAPSHTITVRAAHGTASTTQNFTIRVLPASGVTDHILVSTRVSALGQSIREYTRTGVLVDTFAVSPQTDDARDIIVGEDGRLHVYNGTFDPVLSSLDPDTGVWTTINLAGWSTINNITYGGIATYQNFVFASDMGTAGAGSPSGIVRFDLSNHTATRFDDGINYWDLSLGLDGKLYGLSSVGVKIWDPLTMNPLGIVGLGFSDYRSIAVNSAGEIFVGSWSDGTVSRFSNSGTLLQSVTTSSLGLVGGSANDMDIALDGTLLIDSGGYQVATMSQTFQNVVSFVNSDLESTLFVAFANPQVPGPGLAAIQDANPANNTVTEGALNSTSVGITAFAASASGNVTYSLTDSAGGRFAIDPVTGVVSVANATLLNFESATSHNVTVRASDGLTFSTAMFQIDVFNAAPSIPIDANNSPNSVTQGAANGALVGLTASSADPNGPAVTYSLTNNAGGRFAINASTGVVTVANEAMLNAVGSHNVTVLASDGAGGTANQTFAITVEAPANPPPTNFTDIEPMDNLVFEGAIAGTNTRLRAQATDPNGGITYSLANSDGGRFSIHPTTGVVSVANASLFAFIAAGHNRTVTVRATDGLGASSTQDFSIYAAPKGMFDPTFGANGIATYDILPGGNDGVQDAAIAPDGKIVIAGSVDHAGTPAYDPDFAVVRLNPDGTPDMTFGTGGRVLTDFPGIDFDDAFAVVVQSDRKIVVGGVTGSVTEGYATIVRYNENGSLDSTFGVGGIVRILATNPTHAHVRSLALQPDGKIIASTLIGPGSENVGIIRLLANGTLDTSFSGDGLAAFDTGFNAAFPHRTIVQPDGKILLGGMGDRFFLARLNANGSFDSTFGTNGVAFGVPTGGQDFRDIALLPDGKILGVGELYDSSAVKNRWLLVRYNANGTPDTTFDGDGLWTMLYPNRDFDTLTAVVYHDNRLYVSGQDPEVISFNTNATFDTDFAYGGVHSLYPQMVSSDFQRVLIQEGKLVVVGSGNGVAWVGRFLIGTGPTDIALSNNTVVEGASGAVIGAVTVTDPGDNVSSITVSDNRFEVVGGQLKLKAGQSLNHETEPTVSLSITATDINARSATENFTLSVVNVAPSIPMDSNPANNTVSAQPTNGTLVGITAFATDPNGPTVTYALTDSAGGRFAIDPSTGVVTVANGALLNAAGVLNITVQASDGAGGLSNQTFAIDVLTQVNQLPVFTPGANQTVSEDSGPRTVANWATSISAGPNEASQTVAFQVTGNTNPGLFSVAPAVAANGTLTFTPASDANGAADITLVIQDDGDGANTSASQTFTINVTPVNDPPSFTRGANQTVAEDAGPQTVNGWATALSKGPADEAGQTLNFNVTGNTNTSLFSSQPSVSSNGTLTYTPAANVSGTAIITLVLQDNGGGADTSAPQSFSITINPVNDTPSFTKGANQTVAEDSGAQTIPGWASSISVGPADEAGQAIEFIVTNNNNALFAVQPAVAANGTLTYTPAANAFGSANVTIRIHDNGGTSDGGGDASANLTFTINVNPVNDAPDGSDNTISVNANATYRFTPADFGFTDVLDSPRNNLAAVKFTTTPTNGTLWVSGIAFAFTVTAGSSVPVSTIASGKLSFVPSNSNPSSFLFQVQDDGGTANGGVDLDPSANTFTINVTAVNHAPAGADKSVSTNEDTAITFSTADFGCTDLLDSPSNTLLAVKITTLPGSGTLTINGANVTTGQVVSAANITAGQLRFTPAANANGNNYANFTFQVQDNGGTASGGADLDPSPNNMTINVTSVNDAPAGANNSVFTNEDVPYAFATADFGLTDPNDSPANSLLAVKITALPGAGSLTLNGGAVTTGQSISAANISLLAFTPVVGVNGAPYTSFTFQVQDNGGTANGGIDLDPNLNTITVNVTSINDAPAGANKTITTREDSPYGFVAADFGFSDPNDTQANNLLAVKITTLPSNGNLTLGGSPVNAGQFIPAANLSMLAFNPLLNANGSPYATFTFQVQDDGGTAGNGVDLDPSPNTITMNVAAVNDAPFGANNTLTTNEDTPYSFTTADFGFSDPNDSPANTLFAVKITSTPTAGTLTLGGAPVAAGQFIPVSNITLGQLAYNPAADANGVPYASFTFQVQDNGGTANGGVNLAVSANTIAMNVTPVNDRPIVTANKGTLSYTENDGAKVVDAGFNVTDIDSANLSCATLSFTANYALGQDILSFANQSGITGNFNASIGQLTLTGSAPVSTYQAALRSITYTNTSENPFAATRTLSLVVSDGGPVNSLSTAVTRTTSVIPVNDAPVLNTTPGSNLVQQGTATTADTGVTLTDVDSNNLTGANISITGNFVVSQDVLGFTNQNGIAGNYNATTGTLTLTGTSSVANYQQALRSVTYNNTSPTPSVANRTLSFQVNDGAAANNLSNIATRTLGLNAAPILAPVPDRNISVFNNTIALSASDANGDPLTYGATYQSVGYYLRTTYGLTLLPAKQNYGGQQDKWFQGTGNIQYFILPDGRFYRWDNTANSATGLLLITVNPVYHRTPELVRDETLTGGAVVASVNNNIITFTNLNISVPGQLRVTARVSDGSLSDSESFLATVINLPPVLDPISNQTMAPATDFLTIPLHAVDPEGDAITYSASYTSQAIGLTQQLSLLGKSNRPTADYNNRIGEKWVYAKDPAKPANQPTTDYIWYFILPNGDLTRWDKTPYISKGTFIANVGSFVYANPDLLINFTAVSGMNVTVTGNQLKIDPATGFLGTVVVTAKATDSFGNSDTKTFTVTIGGHQPTLTQSQNYTIARNTSITIPLVATDSDNLPISFRVTSEAMKIKGTYGLGYTTQKYTNGVVQAVDARWMTGAGSGIYFYILPDGRLYRYDQRSTDMTKASTLVTTIDPRYYQNTYLLTDANYHPNFAARTGPTTSTPATGIPGVTAPWPAATYSIINNQLVVTPSASFAAIIAALGTPQKLVIIVDADNGAFVDTKTFTIMVT